MVAESLKTVAFSGGKSFPKVWSWGNVKNSVVGSQDLYNDSGLELSAFRCALLAKSRKVSWSFVFTRG